MPSRRALLAGLGTLGAIGTGGAGLVLSGSRYSLFADVDWEPGAVQVRNDHDARHSITVTVHGLRPPGPPAGLDSGSAEDRCVRLLHRTVDLDPGTAETLADAYTDPGVYRVVAVLDDRREAVNSRIQLWPEDGEITGMETLVTVSKEGWFTVDGFIGPGGRSPPPLDEEARLVDDCDAT